MPPRQPLSAARAAELLSGGGGSGASLFAAIPSDVDPECQQLLQKLTKKDALTRQKALQSLTARFEQLDADALQHVPAQWLLHYPRLVLDPSRCAMCFPRRSLTTHIHLHRHVRLQAAVALQRLVAGLHKGLAPHLRDLLPHWLLSCNDPYRAAATAARDALAELLPRADRRAAAVAMAAEPVRGMHLWYLSISPSY